MPTVHFIVPGSLDQLSGGFLYDRRMVDGLRQIGWNIYVHELAGTFPLVDKTAQTAAAQAMAAISDGTTVVIDGLALPACTTLLTNHATRLRLIALVHLPLAAETLSTQQRATFEQLDRSAFAQVRRIIVTSPHTAAALAAYDVTPNRIGVVIPGTEAARLSQGSGNQQVSLLCVAHVIRRKGYDVLVKALSSLQDLDWRLLSIGSLQRDPVTVQLIDDAIAQHRLAERIRFIGEQPQDEVAAAYQRADVFVLASYYETYGMVLSEAMARGLPVVSTTGGAIPDTVPSAAGLLVTPGDATAMSQALRQIISDRKLRLRVASGARQARQELPSWPQAVKRFAAELDLVRDS